MLHEQDSCDAKFLLVMLAVVYARICEAWLLIIYVLPYDVSGVISVTTYLREIRKICLIRYLTSLPPSVTLGTTLNQR